MIFLFIPLFLFALLDVAFRTFILPPSLWFSMPNFMPPSKQNSSPFCAVFRVFRLLYCFILVLALQSIDY